MQWQGDIVDKLSDNYIPLFIQAHAVYTILYAHIQIKKKKKVTQTYLILQISF